MNMEAGSKFGTGRPATGRTHAVTIRLSEAAYSVLERKKNKSKYIDALIKEDWKFEQREQGRY